MATDFPPDSVTLTAGSVPPGVLFVSNSTCWVSPATTGAAWSLSMADLEGLI